MSEDYASELEADDYDPKLDDPEFWRAVTEYLGGREAEGRAGATLTPAGRERLWTRVAASLRPQHSAEAAAIRRRLGGLPGREVTRGEYVRHDLDTGYDGAPFGYPDTVSDLVWKAGVALVTVGVMLLLSVGCAYTLRWLVER